MCKSASQRQSKPLLGWQRQTSDRHSHHNSHVRQTARLVGAASAREKQHVDARRTCEPLRRGQPNACLTSEQSSCQDLRNAVDKTKTILGACGMRSTGDGRPNDNDAGPGYMDPQLPMQPRVALFHPQPSARRHHLFTNTRPRVCALPVSGTSGTK
eukprot:2983278-Rhodomonas_salina.3